MEASVNEVTQSENGQIAASENPSNHTSEANPENEPFPNNNTCNVRSSDVIQENGYEEPRSHDNQANNVEEALEINGDSMVAIDSNMKVYLYMIFFYLFLFLIQNIETACYNPLADLFCLLIVQM